MKKYTLVEYDEIAFRNITGSFVNDEFDDLTQDPKIQAYAHQAAATIDNLYHHVIDYIFSKPQLSRFSDGSFPVWYGAKELTTTFYETIPHWKKTYIDAPQFSQLAIKGKRSIFTVQCTAALIDLRNHLFNKMNYDNTRQIGARFHHEGHPGLLAKSLRISTGINIIVFQKGILSSPVHHSDYIYEYDPQKQTITVKHADSEKKLLILNKEGF